MELDPRKLQILKAIIDEYILSASPVGSRAISKHEGFHLSSATIRNEMVDLEELGYLEQPHTSAGRIPSDKAYRIYVDRIMHRAELTNDEITIMREHMSGKLDEIESVMRNTAQALSAVTHYTAVVMPMLKANRLKHIQLVPLREGRALMVVVTDTGFARDAVIRVPEGMRVDELERMSNQLTERFRGVRMDQLSERVNTEMGDVLFERREFLNTMVETIARKVEPDAEAVSLSGTTNMLHYPEYADVNKAKMFLSAFEGRDAIYSMLKSASKLEFSVTIGSENESELLKDCSVLTATYRVNNEPVGTFGVIGPTRMHYGRVLSALEYMRRSLSELFSDFNEEGQDRN